MLSAVLVLGDGKASGRSSGNAMNPFQSAFNKLAQYGRASRATKSAGAYGASGAPTVVVGITGNIHPSKYIPMERGEVGSHHTCMQERILISTARVVQPHDGLPPDYVMPQGHDQWIWVPLVSVVATC